MMRLDIISIFPEYFAPLDISLLGKARRRGLIQVHVHNLRDWTHDRHHTVDDTPYGGGPGMVMKPGPWGEALDTIAPPPDPAPGRTDLHGAPPELDSDGTAESLSPADGPTACSDGRPAPPAAAPDEATPSPPGAGRVGRPTPADGEPGAHPGRPGLPAAGRGETTAPGGSSVAGAAPRLIVPMPSGRPFTQAMAVELTAEPWLIFACGRYEGIDARVVEEARTRMRVDEVSIGDYVLAGGEAAVLVMVEAISRLVPGVLGNVESVTDDSFAPGAMETLLEGPVYTKPPVWRGRAVPEILLSGHHGAIARWRREEALRRTAAHRPDLVAALDPDMLDERDRQVLAEAGLPVDGEPVAD